MRELTVYDTHYLTLAFREGKGGKMQGDWELKKTKSYAYMEQLTALNKGLINFSPVI